jgi:CheY-like chemotaxis protein
MSLRVLLVDDNDDTGFAVEMLLRLEGHEVRRAPDGPSALALAESWKPEAALLDIGLPGGMDGFQLAERLRVLLGPNARIVALTGRSGQGDRLRGDEAGFDSFLVKPATLEQLATALK